MPKTKKFIDRKKSITFQLVHRSQQDPLIADENAPQHVLVPIPEKSRGIQDPHKSAILHDDSSVQYLKDSKDNRVEWPQHAEKVIAEKKVKLLLPASVFASEHEEKEGMLSKAAPVSGPQLHLDPDLVAAMDEDFDYCAPENQLEDNFIDLADGVASDQEFDNEFEMESDFRSDEDSFSDSMHSFDKEETKSRFTTYSMTSSVIQRNDQLTLLDDRFEQMYADYDENEIGALDCEEIEGHVPESSDILLQYSREFQKSKDTEQLDKEAIMSKVSEDVDKNSSDEDLVYMQIPEKEKWDCESILSTYSNIYNHPKVIRDPPARQKIEVHKRTGIPCNVLDSNKLTKKALEALGYFESQSPKSTGARSIISQLSTLSFRPQDETPDEKRTRKNALRDYRKERRLEKKANSVAFKEEAKKQIKININNRNNVQGNRIL